MAKKGPIDRYSATAKKIAYVLETGLVKLSTSVAPEYATAATPSRGKVTPVKQNPMIAHAQLEPE